MQNPNYYELKEIDDQGLGYPYVVYIYTPAGEKIPVAFDRMKIDADTADTLFILNDEEVARVGDGLTYMVLHRRLMTKLDIRQQTARELEKLREKNEIQNEFRFGSNLPPAPVDPWDMKQLGR